MLNRMQSIYERFVPNKHLRHGIPFLTFLVVGLYGVREFAQIRYDVKKKYGETAAFQEMMEKGGFKKGKQLDPEEEFERLVVKADLDSWFNIRGPRPGEDSRTIQNKLRQEHKDQLEKEQNLSS